MEGGGRPFVPRVRKLCSPTTSIYFHAFSPFTSPPPPPPPRREEGHAFDPCVFAAGMPSGGCGGGGGDPRRGQSAERQFSGEQAGQRHKQLGPIGVGVVGGEGRGRGGSLREAGRSSGPPRSPRPEQGATPAPGQAAPQRRVPRAAPAPPAPQEPVVRGDRQDVRDGGRGRPERQRGRRRAVASPDPRHAQDRLPGREVREEPDEGLPRLRQTVLRDSVQQGPLQQR